VGPRARKYAKQRGSARALTKTTPLWRFSVGFVLFVKMSFRGANSCCFWWIDLPWVPCQAEPYIVYVGWEIFIVIMERWSTTASFHSTLDFSMGIGILFLYSSLFCLYCVSLCSFKILVLRYNTTFIIKIKKKKLRIDIKIEDRTNIQQLRIELGQWKKLVPFFFMIT